jgi:hypothetical protein
VYKPLRLIPLLLILLVLSACKSGQPTPEALLETPVIPTPEPSATPTIPPNPLAVLLAAPESDAVTLAQVQPVVEQAALQAGLTFEVRQGLDPAAMPAELKLVVALPPAANLQELVTAAPNTQFIALVVPGLTAAPNLTEITGSGQRAAQEGFLAGYISAVMTQEYRVGVLYSTNEPVYGNGFVNGVRYFCGLCQQLYPPFYDYPLTYQIPLGADAGTWQGAADVLIASAVKTMYIAPDLSDNALYEYLAQNGILILGGVTPPPSVASNWLASIQLDVSSTLAQTIPLVLQNGAQGQVSAQLALQNTNTEVLGSGYIMNFNEIVSKLERGIISPGE